MAVLPLLPLIMMLLGILSVVVLGLGVYWVVGWFLGIAGITTALLITGLVFLAITLLGRHLILLLLLARSGSDEPRPDRTGEIRELTMPDNTKIHVEIYGPADSQPIILTHGWTADSTDWYYAKRRLAHRYRLILWDLPGSGKSSRSNGGDYSLDKMAQALNMVIEEITPNRPAIVVGHSMGGMITLNFCKLFPQQLGTHVNGLTLVDTTYTNPAKTTTAAKLAHALQKPVAEPALYIMIALSPLFWVMNWLSYFNGTSLIPNRFASFAGKQTRGQLDYMSLLQPLTPPSVIAKEMLAMFRYDATPALERINVPSLIIVGATDRGCIPAASEYMNAHIPNSQLLMLPKCGHVSIMEENGRVMEAIDGFALRVAGGKPTNINESGVA